MSKKRNSFWDGILHKHNRVERTPKTAADIERLIASVQPEPISESEIDYIVKAVSSGKTGFCEAEPELDWLANVDTSSVEEGVFQLNRNKGADDPDIERQMEEFRKQALERSDDEQKSDDEQESDVETD